jgi:hypothetical protein
LSIILPEEDEEKYIEDKSGFIKIKNNPHHYLKTS